MTAMANAPAPAPPTDSPATLLTGIVGDAQRLIEQQFRLMRREIERDVHQTIHAGIAVAIGGAMLLLSLSTFALSAAHGLHAWASPVSDPATLPLWACHAMVGGALLGGSLVALLIGRSWFGQLQPLRESAAAAEETLEWATNQK